MTFVTDLAKIPPVTLGTRLRISREWRGHDQAEMAEVLGVTRQTVSNYEREATPMSKLAINAWAAHCGVDVEWLKTGEIFVGTDPSGEQQPTDYGAVVSLFRNKNPHQMAGIPFSPSTRGEKGSAA